MAINGPKFLEHYSPPEWVKIAVYLIVNVGLWPLLSLILIGILIGVIKSPSIENQNLIKILGQNMVLHSEETRQFRQMFLREMSLQNQWLEQICDNTAKERRDCRIGLGVKE
jgi:hypothetical protein